MYPMNLRLVSEAIGVLGCMGRKKKIISLQVQSLNDETRFVQRITSRKAKPVAPLMCCCVVHGGTNCSTYEDVQLTGYT